MLRNGYLYSQGIHANIVYLYFFSYQSNDYVINAWGGGGTPSNCR